MTDENLSSCCLLSPPIFSARRLLSAAEAPWALCLRSAYAMLPVPAPHAQVVEVTEEMIRESERALRGAAAASAEAAPAASQTASRPGVPARPPRPRPPSRQAESLAAAAVAAPAAALLLHQLSVAAGRLPGLPEEQQQGQRQQQQQQHAVQPAASLPVGLTAAERPSSAQGSGRTVPLRAGLSTWQAPLLLLPVPPGSLPIDAPAAGVGSAVATPKHGMDNGALQQERAQPPQQQQPHAQQWQQRPPHAEQPAPSGQAAQPATGQAQVLLRVLDWQQR